MTLSIDVLPAPFGPMIARISPLRMSNETSRIALHAAERQRDVLDRQQHLALGEWPPAFAADRLVLHVGLHSAASLKRRGRPDNVFASTMRMSPVIVPLRPSSNVTSVSIRQRVAAVVERGDQRRISLGDEAAAHLLRPRQLAVVGVELLVQDQEALDLRAGHRAARRQARRFTSATCPAIIS